MMRKLLPLWALLLGGCVAAPSPTRPAVPVPAGVSEARLVAGSWTLQSGVFLMEQRAEFDFRGHKLEMRGLMRLDTRAGRARLVAIDDLGIKLFDLTVTRDGQTLNSVLPQLAKYPRLGEGIAASVRRIFLAPRPSAGDTLQAEPTAYVLSRPWKGGTLRFTFGGRVPVLQSAEATGGSAWRIDYFTYRRQQGIRYPRPITG
jgi:hypothetical protein